MITYILRPYNYKDDMPLDTIIFDYDENKNTPQDLPKQVTAIHGSNWDYINVLKKTENQWDIMVATVYNEKIPGIVEKYKIVGFYDKDDQPLDTNIF